MTQPKPLKGRIGPPILEGEIPSEGHPNPSRHQFYDRVTQVALEMEEGQVLPITFKTLEDAKRFTQGMVSRDRLKVTKRRHQVFVRRKTGQSQSQEKTTRE